MVRLFTGRAGTGKTERMVEEIIRLIDEDPLGPPIYLIVPDQVTFYMERELTRRVGGQALVRAQVMNFRRFSWRGLQSIGKLPIQPISKNGKFAMAAAVYEKVANQLQVLGRDNPSPSFIERILLTLDEFQSAKTSSSQLVQIALQCSPGSQLEAKLQDISLLLEVYEQSLQGRFIDPLHLIPLFTNNIEKYTSLSLAHVYVDGFLGFTAQEFTLLGELFAHIEHMNIAITIPFERAKTLQDNGFSMFSLFDTPFIQADDTFLRVRQLVIQKQVDMEILGDFTEKTWRFTSSKRLAHLERFLFASLEPGEQPFHSVDDVGDLMIATASTQKAEVVGTVRELLRIHREEAVPWHDFTLIVTDMDRYRPLLRDVLQQARVPFFMDELQLLRYHPLARFIQSALEMIENHLDSHTLIQWLKTDLVPLPRHTVDLLENFVLSHGIEGDAWWDSFTISQRTKNVERVEAVRAQVATWLLPLYQALHHPARTMRSMVKALWTLIETLHIPEQISVWITREIEDSHPLVAQEHERAMNAVIAICDDLVAAFDERPSSITQFTALFRQAFASTSVGAIPLLLDQVMITDVSRVRAYEVQVAFVLGCNDGLLPRKIGQDEIITDEERDLLITQGLYVNPDSAKQQLYERYRVYMALTRAKQKLYISYALGDADGRSLTPAVSINQLRTHFNIGQISEKRYYDYPLFNDQIDQELCITEDMTAQYVATVLRDVKKGMKLTPMWHAVYELYASGTWSQELLRSKLRGLAYTIDSEPLAQEIAKELFHNAEVSSVSRLERFAACPFAHFAQYGLALKQREEMDVNVLLRGQFIHEVLHQFVLYLQENNIDWSMLSNETAQEIVNQIFTDTLSLDGQAVWMQNARFRNYSEQIRQALQRAIATFTEHAHRSEFHVQLTEEAFEFELPGIQHVRLKGRIDRLDTADLQGQPYFRIIDFKSSERSVELDQVYYGLSLQLILYAHVVEQQSADLLGMPHLFAGVFYYPVRDPVKLVNTPTSEKEIEQTKRKVVRMKGLLLREPKIAALLDRNHEMKDDLFPTLLKKDGQFRSNVPTVSREEWLALTDHVNRTAALFVSHIRAGSTDITPYRHGKKTACNLCSFQGLCQFEHGGGLGTYRELVPLKTQAVLEQLTSDGEVQ